ncbi:MAG: Fur family transcriptional regulator [Roseburia sp.]|uniref:transcriptional repressor n=1 Tax=Roseburia hominis TaxID=301301 RepID=UPI001F199E4D
MEKEGSKKATNDTRKQEILQRLRKMNYRITNQRMLLLDIILNGEYSSCKEIYCEAHKKDRNIGIATVYRMVNTLEEIGAISWKKLSQIYSENWNGKEKICRIVLDDETEIELSEQKWKRVVECGLKCLGFAKNQELKSLELKDENTE